jgi:hypothetical protein
MYMEQLSQALSIAAAPIHAQVINNQTVNTGAVDMQKFHRALFVLDVGTTGAGFSLTALLQESPDNVSWFTLAGTTINAITGTSKVATLECRADQLTSTTSPARRYVRCQVTEGNGQNVTVAVIPLGGEAVQKPGSAQDVAAGAPRLGRGQSLVGGGAWY